MPATETSHIVDTLIEERAGRLRHNRQLWRLVRRFAYPGLGYADARAMADRIADMGGQEVFDDLSNLLNLKLQISGLPSIPEQGLAFVTPNHPAGIADGIAVYDALKRVRKDVCFFANRDAIRVAPALAEVIIPVEWMAQHRTSERQRETLTAMARAIRAEKLIVLFPSGRMARPSWKGLQERPWQNTAVKIAAKHACPLVPLHITARNSALFYLFAVLNEELRDMSLFRELLNKQQKSYTLKFGEAIHPSRTTCSPDRFTRALQLFVEADLKHHRTHFTPPMR